MHRFILSPQAWMYSRHYQDRSRKSSPFTGSARFIKMQNIDSSQADGAQLQSIGNLLSRGMQWLGGAPSRAPPPATAGNLPGHRISEEGDPDDYNQQESTHSKAQPVECCAPACKLRDIPLTDSERVCDSCGGSFHLLCGFEIDKNDLTTMDLSRDWSTITHWCGCDLPPDSPQFASKRARSSAGPAGTADKSAASRGELWSRLESRAGETVRLLSDDRRHCVAEVRLPMDLEGFGKFHFRILPGDMCKVGLVAVTGEAETCGQTAWMDDEGADVVGGTTRLVDIWGGSMIAVPVGCIECHPEPHDPSSGPQFSSGAGPNEAEQQELPKPHEDVGDDQEREEERHGSEDRQGQERRAGATNRYRVLSRLKSPEQINKVIATEMDKIQKSFAVIYRRTGYEMALLGIGDTGGADTILKMATNGLSPLITDQWLNPEKTLPAVKQQTQVNTILQENRAVSEKGDNLKFSDLPTGAQVHLLEGLLGTALPTSKNAPYTRTSTSALRAMSVAPFGTCAWYPPDVKYRPVQKMEATDRLRVFQALARHAEQNSLLKLALENSIYGDISWDNSMAASFFMLLNREMRNGAAAAPETRDTRRVPPSSDALVGLLPPVATINMTSRVPTPTAPQPHSTKALDAAQVDIKGGWSNCSLLWA